MDGAMRTGCWPCLKKLYAESNRVIRAPRLIDIPMEERVKWHARRDVDYLDYSGVFDEWFHLELRFSGKVRAVSSPGRGAGGRARARAFVRSRAQNGHGPRVSKAKVGLYLRNIAFNAGSLRKCRGGVANLYDGIQFIPVNYSAFSLDFLSFRELARIVPAVPQPPGIPFPPPHHHPASPRPVTVFLVMRTILYTYRIVRKPRTCSYKGIYNYAAPLRSAPVPSRAALYFDLLVTFASFFFFFYY